MGCSTRNSIRAESRTSGVGWIGLLFLAPFSSCFCCRWVWFSNLKLKTRKHRKNAALHDRNHCRRRRCPYSGLGCVPPFPVIRPVKIIDSGRLRTVVAAACIPEPDRIGKRKSSGSFTLIHCGSFHLFSSPSQPCFFSHFAV